MPRYTQAHYEDVARILAEGHIGLGASKSAYHRGLGGIAALKQVAYDFADLFTANNPRRCERCTAPFPRSEGEVCMSARYGTPGDHQFSGFDRAEFLRACGVESEG